MWDGLIAEHDSCRSSPHAATGLLAETAEGLAPAATMGPERQVLRQPPGPRSPGEGEVAICCVSGLRNHAPSASWSLWAVGFRRMAPQGDGRQLLGWGARLPRASPCWQQGMGMLQGTGPPGLWRDLLYSWGALGVETSLQLVFILQPSCRTSLQPSSWGGGGRVCMHAHELVLIS